MQLGSHTKPCC